LKTSSTKVTALIVLLSVIIGAGAAWFLMRSLGTSSVPAEADTGGRKVLYYKSTMMLGEISQTSRKDSMGMEMVPVYEGEEDSTAIKIDPVTMQNMGIRTASVTQGPVHRSIRTVGKIEFDETAVSEVTTRVPGWIEKLYVDSTGKLVHKGEPLFEFYSPDLYLTEREYLLAFVQGEAAAAPVLNKLYHLGLSPGQIENLRKTRQVPHTLRIDSPRDGVVVEKNALQGTMTEPGKTLYRIGDIGKVWVLADIYEQDLPFLQVGQEAVVKLSYMPDRSFRGKVTYIYPTVEEKTRTARGRMEFPNPGFFLKPGMFATVEIHALLVSEAVLVPDMAVLRSGEKNTVFVALEGGKFEPREITLGAKSRWIRRSSGPTTFPFLRWPTPFSAATARREAARLSWPKRNSTSACADTCRALKTSEKWPSASGRMVCQSCSGRSPTCSSVPTCGAALLNATARGRRSAASLSSAMGPTPSASSTMSRSASTRR
jgi:multidrug efflux pump subunit AcrA (membrane-fusion protein)